MVGLFSKFIYKATILSVNLKHLHFLLSCFQRPHQGTTDAQVGNKSSQDEQRSPPGVILYQQLDCWSQDEGPNATS